MVAAYFGFEETEQVKDGNLEEPALSSDEETPLLPETVSANGRLQTIYTYRSSWKLPKNVITLMIATR